MRWQSAIASASGPSFNEFVKTNGSQAGFAAGAGFFFVCLAVDAGFFFTDFIDFIAFIDFPLLAFIDFIAFIDFPMVQEVRCANNASWRSGYR